MTPTILPKSAKLIRLNEQSDWQDFSYYYAFMLEQRTECAELGLPTVEEHWRKHRYFNSLERVKERFASESIPPEALLCIHYGENSGTIAVVTSDGRAVEISLGHD